MDKVSNQLISLASREKVKLSFTSTKERAVLWGVSNQLISLASRETCAINAGGGGGITMFPIN